MVTTKENKASAEDRRLKALDDLKKTLTDLQEKDRREPSRAKILDTIEKRLRSGNPLTSHRV